MPEQGSTQPLEVIQSPDRQRPALWRRAVAGGLILAGVGIGVGGYAILDDEDAANTDPQGLLANGNIGDAERVTDSDLRQLDLGDYNCGGHLQPVESAGRYGVDYAINYYNQHPELGTKMRQFHIDTLGKDAWDSLLKNGKGNSNTNANKHFKGDSSEDKEVDQLLHMRAVAGINVDRTYANFTCAVNGKVDIQRAGNKPTITIPASNHVEGITVNEAGLRDFESKVKRNADGSVPVDIVDVGTRQVTYGKNDLRTEHLYLFALYADGCDNPILRLTHPKKEVLPTTTTKPVVTTTTKPQATTTTKPSVTTTTTTTRPTTTIPKKRDDGVLPGDGTPAARDPGTPDRAGTGPAGQTPNSSGYVPGEQAPSVPSTSPNTTTTTTTRVLPSATTSPQPTSTSAPVTATTSVPQPPVQTAPRPPKP